MTQPATGKTRPIFIVGCGHMGADNLKAILRGEPDVPANDDRPHSFPRVHKTAGIQKSVRTR